MRKARRRTVLEPQRMPRVRFAAKRDADADAVALTTPRSNRSRRACGAFLATRGQFRRLAEGRAAHQEFTTAGAGQTLTAPVSPDPTMTMPAPAVLPRKLSGSALFLNDQESVSAWQLGSPQRLYFRCAGRRETPSAIYRRCFPKCRGAAPRVARNVHQACQTASNFGADAISMMFTAAQVAPINLA